MNKWGHFTGKILTQNSAKILRGIPFEIHSSNCSGLAPFVVRCLSFRLRFVFSTMRKAFKDFVLWGGRSVAK
jgi:hypothetical protein